MNDWLSTAMDVQAQMLRAQKAQWDAAQQLLDAGRSMNGFYGAGMKAAEANMDAWKQWSALWGWK